MMNQKEWDLLSLYIVLRLTNDGLVILTPEEAQAIESSDGEEIRALSFFEEHVAKVVNGQVCDFNGAKYLVLNRTYFMYSYHCDIVTACSRILRDGNTLVSEIVS